MLWTIVKAVSDVGNFADVVNVVAGLHNESDGCSPQEFETTIRFIALKHGFGYDELFNSVSRALYMKGD